MKGGRMFLMIEILVINGDPRSRTMHHS